MIIDFSPIDRKEVKILEFSRQFSVTDLRVATNASLDRMLALVNELNDAQVTFLPHDPNADDPYAVEGEEHIGWSVAHLLVHVTASSEEGAAFSSWLARGIATAREPRPRYETSWHNVTTQAQCLQRLEESRRIRLAYLDTWPDAPHLDVFRELSEKGLEYWGQINAPASFLAGLKHEVGHYDQLLEAARQAKAAVAGV